MSTMAVQKESFPEAALKAVVLYEGADLAARAITLLERSAARAGEDLKWDVQPWPIDALKQPSFGDVTLPHAADADLILFVLGEIYPPPEIWDWLERWAASRRQPDAALMSLGLAGTASQRWQTRLALFAKQRGLALLGGHNMDDENGPVAVLRLRPRRKPMAAPVLPPVMEPFPVPSHWGIND